MNNPIYKYFGNNEKAAIKYWEIACNENVYADYYYDNVEGCWVVEVWE